MILKGRRGFVALVVFALIVSVFSVTPSCSIKYSMSGTNLNTALIKTFTVYYFPNRARMVNPTLSQNFTEKLKEKLQRQTPLNELEEGGDLEFEGQITGYEIRPMAVQKDDLASQNRLTISVKLKYTNNKEPEQSFERNFSGFEDYDSEQDISSIEDDLVTDILKKIHEDIFNATIANW